MRSGSDPISEDLAELDARAEEEAREVLWDAFVDAIKARKAVLHHWSDVMKDVTHALLWDEEGGSPVKCFASGYSDFLLACTAFAEAEGWDGVLSAIARAMREQARDAE